MTDTRPSPTTPMVGSLVRRALTPSGRLSPPGYGVVTLARLHTVDVQWFPDMALTELFWWQVEVVR